MTSADQAYDESRPTLDDSIDGLQLLQRSTLKTTGVKPQLYEEELVAVLGEPPPKHHRHEPRTEPEDVTQAAEEPPGWTRLEKESNEAEAAGKAEVEADVQPAAHEQRGARGGSSASRGRGVRSATNSSQELKEHAGDMESERHRHAHVDEVVRESHNEAESGTMEPPCPFHILLDRISRAVTAAVRRMDGEGTQNPATLLVAYPMTVLFVVAMIVVIYWPQGGSVITRILIYLFALSTMKLAVKFVFEEYSFHYPKFITALHMAASALAGFLVLLYRRLAQRREIAVPTLHEFFLKVVPVSLGFALSLAANNMALVFCSASFAEIVGSTSPIFSVGMMSLLGLPFDKRLLLPTCVVVLGCMLSVSGELDFSPLGFGLVLLANFARSFKVTLQAELMTGETKEKFDPCTLLAWMCTASCALMLGWCLATEGVAPMHKFYHHERRRGLAIFVGVSCANACVLNAAMLFVTKELGAVGSQLVAQIKAVLTVLGGMALFGDSVSRSECVGFVAVLSGAFAYSRMEKWLKEEKAKKALEWNLTCVK